MTPKPFTAKFAVLLAATAAFTLTGSLGHMASAENILKQSKLIIEHNATDNDTGFQAFVDADGWNQVKIIGPKGVVAEINGRGAIHKLGMTELFFETTEPENAKMSIKKVLAMFPAGEYRFEATASPLGELKGTVIGKAKLTHNIPAGVTLLEPAKEAVVPKGDVKMRWKPSNKALDGSAVKIIAYQLLVEKDQDPHPRMMGKRGALSMHLAPSVTQITVPSAFFEPKSKYSWEVLAIEEGGNQTLQSGEFKTK